MGKHYRKDTNNKPILKIASIASLSVVLFLGGIYLYKSMTQQTSPNQQIVENNPDVTDNNGKISEGDASADDKETKVEQEPVLPIITEANAVITAVGDCTIGTDDRFNKSTSLPALVQKNSGSSSYLFSNVSSIFKEDDITIANLETTFTNATAKRDKNAAVQYHFKGDPSLAESLVVASIEGVNLSNNHIYDYGEKGFNDTISTLKNYNIPYFGEGNQWIKEANGIKFGFLGYQGWTASDSLMNKIKSDVESLKTQVDVVIVSFHWGEERKYTPNATQKKLAHHAVDSGADLVIGHHPHVIQGVEKYKDRYINYSLGNFCFGGNSNPSDKDTYIFQADFKFTDKKLTSLGVRVIPCSVSSVPNTNDYRPTPLAGNAKIKMLDKLNKLCINLGDTLDDSYKYLDIK